MGEIMSRATKARAALSGGSKVLDDEIRYLTRLVNAAFDEPIARAINSECDMIIRKIARAERWSVQQGQAAYIYTRRLTIVYRMDLNERKFMEWLRPNSPDLLNLEALDVLDAVEREFAIACWSIQKSQNQGSEFSFTLPGAKMPWFAAAYRSAMSKYPIEPRNKPS
jgi:hypothetical protein